MITLTIPKPNPKQALFFTNPHKYLGYGGAKGGGKSWGLRTKAALLCIGYPGITVTIVRRTYPELRDNHIDPLKRLLGITAAGQYNDGRKEITAGWTLKAAWEANRMENRMRACELWVEACGKRTVKTIAAELGEKLATVKSWKLRDKWRLVSTKDVDGEQEFAVEETESEQWEDSAITEKDEQSESSLESIDRASAEGKGDDSALTDVEKDFCLACALAPNATQAAYGIGHYGTYAAAKQGAYRMMRKKAVKDEIQRLKAIKRRTWLIDSDDVVDLHMRIAFADITRFVDFGRESVPVTDRSGPVMVVNEKTGEKEPLTTERDFVRIKSATEVDGQLISEVRLGSGGAVVKLADRQKSLEFLERYLDLNPMDRHKKIYENERLEMERQKVKDAGSRNETVVIRFADEEIENCSK